jgi:hypothetical protein
LRVRSSAVGQRRAYVLSVVVALQETVDHIAAKLA